MTLREKIAQEIRKRGPMRFSRYMELCLYEPSDGYYARSAEKFGKAGDFYTSSDVHAVFGRLLARQFDEMWHVLGEPEQVELVEYGPGRGLFAQDVMDWSEKKFPAFFEAMHYRMVERSAELRGKIQETLAGRIAAGKASMTAERMRLTAEQGPSRPAAAGKGTASAVPNEPAHSRALAPEVPAIVFANEFFDAFPVEIVSARGELRLEFEDGRIVERWVPVSEAVLEYLDRYSVQPEEYERLEAPLAAQAAMAELANEIERGFVVVIDYGYTRAEQLAGRHRGTLRAFRQHSMSANPYEAPGEQDLTADVNFTALAAAAEGTGLRAQKLVTQSQFLMGIGETNQFADTFEGCVLPQEKAKVALQLKHLATPAGMGESFQVLVMSRGVEQERAKGLAGCKFG